MTTKKLDFTSINFEKPEELILDDIKDAVLQQLPETGCNDVQIDLDTGIDYRSATYQIQWNTEPAQLNIQIAYTASGAYVNVLVETVPSEDEYIEQFQATVDIAQVPNY